MLSLCTFMTVAGVALSFKNSWDADFTYNTFLDEDNNFKLYWTHLDEDTYEIGMEAKATGWIAFGVSPNGQMPGSDIMIGWVENGKAYLQDRFAAERSTPIMDATQDLQLLEGEEEDGWTRIRFTRPKRACDPDDLSIIDGTSRVIWALHTTNDPEEECFTVASFHDKKGSQSLNMDTGLPPVVQLEDDVETFEVGFDNFEIPSDTTTYWCSLVEMPVFEETVYLVKTEQLVTPGNEALVHHLLAYLCPLADTTHVGEDHSCHHWGQAENMPGQECRNGELIHSWAIGGLPIYTPEVAAIPIGGATGIRHLFLEMHYDNPLARSGVRDSSGVRMFFTRNPRQYDAGIVSFGTVPSKYAQVVPPGISNGLNRGWWPAECTEDFPADGITIVGAFHHQHTIGTGGVLHHIRDGEELEPILTNLNYDFNYQQFENIKPTKILPGDELYLDCHLDSSSRTDFTFGGEASTEEMCLIFLMYYPKQPLIGAFGMPTAQSWATWATDAENEGYLSGVVRNDDGSVSFDNAQWDSSQPGHEEFYNRIDTDAKYTQRNFFCNNAEPVEDKHFQNWQADLSFTPFFKEVESCPNGRVPKTTPSQCEATGGIKATGSTGSSAQMKAVTSILFSCAFIIYSLLN